MSAIAGVWSFEHQISSDAFASMMSALSVYGAQQTSYARPSLAIGCCQSCSLPEDRIDRQPLSGIHVTALVADVRLDNREQLAAELGIATQTLLSMADSALILAAWERWQEQCVHHLQGAFAFAVWNQAEQHLFLARDHSGERPLYYSALDHSFAFASMPKGLHPLPFVGSEIDEGYAAHWLAMVNTPPDLTIFRRITLLGAGCSLSVRRGRMQLQRYWQTDGLAELRLRSVAGYLECFTEQFDRAVRVRLRTIGGISAHLSGGLDSSSVAATAAGMLAAQGQTLTCFTAVPKPGFIGLVGSKTHFADEGDAAAEVVALYPNMRHERIAAGNTSFLDEIDRMNGLYDMPCFVPHNEMWSSAIYKRAREQGITLLLGGNCGNATISYEGLPALSTWFRSGQWGKLARVAWQLRRARATSTRLLVRHAVWPSLPLSLRRLTDPHLRSFSLSYTLLHPEVVARLDLARAAFLDYSKPPGDGRIMLRNLLTYGDVSETHTASQGGWQIDYRDPTYDRGVIEFCLAVPLEEFMRGGQLRSLVRRAMAGRLPESTRRRTMRGRQSADWYLNMAAVHGEMVDEVQRLQRSPLASRMLDLQRMRSLIDNWPTSGFDRNDVASPYNAALSRGFAMGRFLMKYDPDLAQV